MAFKDIGYLSEALRIASFLFLVIGMIGYFKHNGGKFI